MICTTRLIANNGTWLITNDTDNNYDTHLQPFRSVVVRLLSNGPKWQTKEGYLRDTREHDANLFGIEYEIELVDYDNEPARFWLEGSNRCLNNFKALDIAVLGWKRVFGVILPTAWRLEECTHLSS